ncbi:MAG: DUF4097 family beta strand repeat-containing protein [Candidatus Ozemobacteraceae bacterium]
MSDARRMILKMLAEGKITVEESEKLLAALNSGAKNEDTSHSRRVHDDEEAYSQKRRHSEDYINPFIQATKLGFDLRNIAQTVQQTVQQAVKKAEPRRREFKDKMKEFGNWMQEVVDTMATEITTSNGDLTDSIDINFVVAPIEGIEDCKKFVIENIFGEIRINKGSEFKMKVIGRISQSVLGEYQSGQWFSKNGIRIKDNTLYVGFDREQSIQAIMDMEITMPENSEIVCRTVSSGIKIKGEFKIKEIKSVSGNIRLQGADLYKSYIETVSGTVQIDNCCASPEMKSTSGDFIIKDSKITDLKINSVSGDLMLTESEVSKEAKVALVTTSGDIIIERIKGPWSMISAATRSGNISLDWRGTISDSCGGKILRSGNDGAEFAVESVSGDIQFN